MSPLNVTEGSEVGVGWEWVGPKEVPEGKERHLVLIPEIGPV